MSVTLDSTPQRDADAESYRALCSSAAVSLAAGVLSITACLDWRLAVIPAIGMFMGAHALWRIGQQPEELTGAGVAKLGVILSGLFWAGGWGYLGFTYATEVPEGYQRITYAALQPDAAAPAAKDGQTPPVPESARQLDGQRVFIKGYMYPGARDSRIASFVLVRDNGTCCFGGPTPKLTDMIEVTLAEPLRINYTMRTLAVAGTFHVQTGAVEGLGQVLYKLDADYAK